MNEVRSINALIQQNEKLLLQQRKESNRQSTVKSFRTISIFQAVIVLILVAAFLIVQNNTNARNRVKAELVSSKEWFYTTLSSIGDAVIATDIHGAVTFMNPVAQHLTGWSEEEAKGVSLDIVFDIVNEHTHSVVPSPVRQVLEHGKISGLANHTLLRKRDHTEIPIDDSAAPIMDSKGNMKGVVLVFRDVTEQKENESALKESEEKFQKAFQASAAGITITRMADATLLEVNDAFVQMTGYKREELVGHSSAELGMIANFSKREEVTQQVQTHGSAKNFEMTVRHKSGKLFNVLVSIVTILLKHEKYALNVIHDITERKKSEEQIEAANKELEAFSYSVSHDLRSPIRALIGYSGILEEDYNEKLDEEGKRVLAIIKQNSLKMNTLIEDLLEFSKLGTQALKKSEIDTVKLVHTVFHDVSQNFSHKARLIVNSLPPMYADYALLTQVWVNLISNALKYSAGKEEPLVEIGSFKEADETVYYIKDNGAGFNMQYADKLFGVFQRLHSTHEFEGTGVGLSIVKRIIARHGGRVWAEGKLNEGATFYFTLQND